MLNRLLCLLLGHTGCSWSRRLRACQPKRSSCSVMELVTSEQADPNTIAIPVVRAVVKVCERCGTLYSVPAKES